MCTDFCCTNFWALPSVRDIPVKFPAHPSLRNSRKTNFRGRDRAFRPPPLRVEDPRPTWQSPGPKKLVFVLFFLRNHWRMKVLSNGMSSCDFQPHSCYARHTPPNKRGKCKGKAHELTTCGEPSPSRWTRTDSLRIVAKTTAPQQGTQLQHADCAKPAFLNEKKRCSRRSRQWTCHNMMGLELDWLNLKGGEERKDFSKRKIWREYHCGRKIHY